MKYYEVQTPEGPLLVGTLKEVGKRPYKTVDIPVDKERLMTYVNDLRRFAVAEGIESVATIARPSVASTLVELMDNPPAPRIATKIFEPDDIVDILVDARGFQLANYFGAVMEAASRVQKETTNGLT